MKEDKGREETVKDWKRTELKVVMMSFGHGYVKDGNGENERQERTGA